MKKQVSAVNRGALGRRDAFRLGGVGLAVAGLAACSRVEDGGTGGGGAATLDTIRERGYVRVGLANEQPFGFIDGSGSWAGQSPSLAAAIFEELGVSEIQATPVTWDGLIPGLQSDRFDVVAAGMFVNPERCEQVLFSEPTAQSPEAFLVDSGNPFGITNFESFLDNEEAVLAVLNASVEQGYAESVGIPESQLEIISDQTQGYELLSSGRVDAVSMPSASNNYILQSRGGDFEVTEPFFPVIDGEEQRGYGALAFPLGNEALVDEVNAVLADFKENGRLLEIGQEWGFSEADLPGDVTTEELCS
ncbi:ectoine/hydroxyectoine ABC transporter substrate-binding protein EhuB [Nocardiopsis sp. NPDC049922]|uniref:ectoine/hydroxyectoine ABC transporter substrate-binding protein EhuB n=1 Tax=Nocardiopsis sp. NPDC049922 TaxID=3155157 RepID=UPI0033F0D962